MEATARAIKLSDLQPSKTNPRQSFDKTALEELADSIRRHGVLQPILVRPLNGCYEIVAGERRYRAAKTAGVKELPAVVRALTDLEAVELQVVENLQREDLHPLEEAEGYHLLQKQHGYSADTIAEKVGKSRAYIFGRLKLRKLPAAVKKKFAAGEIPASNALLLATIPDPKACARAARDAGSWSHRDLLEQLQEHYRVQLKGCSWKLDDAELLPAAGNCKACPKRSGNLGLEDAGDPNVCTDPSCFRKKVEASARRRKEEAAAAGQKVLSPREAKKVFPYRNGAMAWNAPYADLDEGCYDDPKHRNWRRLLGKDRPDVVLAEDPAGKIHELVPKDAARRKLREKYDWAKDRAEGPRGNPEETRRKKAHKLRLEAIREALPELARRAESRVAKNERAFLRFVALRFLHHGSSDARKAVTKRRDWPKPRNPHGWGVPKEWRDLLEGMTAPELWGFVIEFIATDHASSSWNTQGYSDQWLAACELTGIDIRGVEARLKKEKAARKKKRGKKAPRRKK